MSKLAQTNPMNPRNPLNRPPPKKHFSDPILTELEGCTALGMEAEALRLANRILRKPTITGAQFEAAVHTLLTMESHLKRRRKLVEKAHGRLSTKAQRHARFWMLSFCHSAKDYATASRFLPKRFNGPNGLFELAWAWDIWSGLNDEKSLEKFFLTLATSAASAGHPYTRGLLLTCLGDYCLRTGQWQLAGKFYQLIPVESANTQQAVLGPLLALSGEMLATCQTSRETLSRFKHHHDPDLDVILPGNLSSQHREIERQLNIFERGLRRMLGKKGLKQLKKADAQ